MKRGELGHRGEVFRRNIFPGSLGNTHTHIHSLTHPLTHHHYPRPLHHPPQALQRGASLHQPTSSWWCLIHLSLHCFSSVTKDVSHLSQRSTSRVRHFSASHFFVLFCFCLFFPVGFVNLSLKIFSLCL